MTKKPKDQHEDVPPDTHEEQPDPEPDFDAIWEMLARSGKCDAKHGMEYRRVLRTWKKAGKPAPIIHYIRTEANRMPDTEE
jgi:hypothetical protein